MKYYVANWKANKNWPQADQWFEIFLKEIGNNKSISDKLKNNLIRIIVCPPLPFLVPLKEKIGKLKNFYLGAQDISVFEPGTHTGETTVDSVKNLVNYVLVGHSERRIGLNETNETVRQKASLAKKHSLEPILCVRDEKDLIVDVKLKYIAYEPVDAIGNGNNASLKQILDMKERLQLDKEIIFLYGGSVNEDNIAQYSFSESVNGFLIGSASLNPTSFFKLIKSS